MATARQHKKLLQTATTNMAVKKPLDIDLVKSKLNQAVLKKETAAPKKRIVKIENVAGRNNRF